jgi:hypothetical protein
MVSSALDYAFFGLDTDGTSRYAFAAADFRNSRRNRPAEIGTVIKSTAHETGGAILGSGTSDFLPAC